MKHPTSKRQGYAPRKSTKKSLLDWKHLANQFKTHATQIQRHKHDQIYLKALKTRLESRWAA